MKVLIVTQYFPPEVGAPQARLSELAGHWAAAGGEVTVLTGMPNHPTGLVPDEYRGKRRMIEQVDGYRVVRTWLYATPNEGVVKKTLSHLSFMVTSVLLGSGQVGRPDVVVVSSPTFFSIFSAWLLSRVKRARFVVEIRDLWPALFVELGVLTSRPIIWVLERLELAAYRAADEVVVVTEGFREDLMRRGVAPNKVDTIPNGVDIDRFDPSTPPAPRSALGARPGDFTVLYIGAHGLSQGLPAVLEAAEVLQEEGIRVTFVGEGAMKPELERIANERDLGNVTFLDPVSRHEVPPLLAAADVCLVTLRDIPLFRTFIPSKMFEYLAMEKVVVGAVDGEAARILTEAGAAVVPPEDGKAMAQAIIELMADPQARQEMGAVGADFVRANFDRRKLASQYRALLERVVDARGAGRAGRTS